MIWRWVLPAAAATVRIAGAAGSAVLTRSETVRRALTIADILPAPVSAVGAEGVQFTVPAGVSIVTMGGPKAGWGGGMGGPKAGWGGGMGGPKAGWGGGMGGPAATAVGEYLADLVGGSVPRAGDERPAGGIALILAPGYADEEYALEVDGDGVTIRASGGAGLFYGVQTLRQLMPPNGPAVVPGVRVADRPRFAYRGVMLDVARHFFDVAAVKRLIDLAALYKINHLHLHLSDDQGWRIAIESWPKLTTVGAGTQVGGGPGGHYTAADYREIVAYAQARFITVVPEIDLPGHTNAALVAYPELGYERRVPRQYTGTRVGFSALCPAREATSRFLEDVLGEVAALTPGPYLHIGGDEALAMPAEDYAAVVTRAQTIVAAHGKTAVGWHEVAGAPLAATTVLQFWGVTPWARDVLAASRAGNRLILSPADRTYLDQRHDLRSGAGRTWAGPISAERAYGWDPGTHLAGVAESAVLGVEAPLWTETVTTVDQMEYLMFPRLAATAELGWSPRSTHDWSAFRHRLGAQAPRWEALGVHFARIAGVPWVASPPATSHTLVPA